jgi:hypothetical protein
VDTDRLTRDLFPNSSAATLPSPTSTPANDVKARFGVGQNPRRHVGPLPRWDQPDGPEKRAAPRLRAARYAAEQLDQAWERNARMGQRMQVIFEDDIDGSEAEGTVTFALNGAYAHRAARLRPWLSGTTSRLFVKGAAPRTGTIPVTTSPARSRRAAASGISSLVPTCIGRASGVSTAVDSPLTPLAVPLLVDPDADAEPQDGSAWSAWVGRYLSLRMMTAT